MPKLPSSTSGSMGRVHNDMPSVLYPSYAHHTPKQAFGVCNAGIDIASQIKPWPGRSFGIRAPEPGETPLSVAEAVLALREGVV